MTSIAKYGAIVALFWLVVFELQILYYQLSTLWEFCYFGEVVSKNHFLDLDKRNIQLGPLLLRRSVFRSGSPSLGF